MKRPRGEGGGARRCEIGKRNHETRSLRRCEMVETGDIHGIGRGRGFGPGVVINWELNSRDNHYLPPYLRSFSSLSPPLPSLVARSQLASAHYKKHVSSLLAIYFRMVHITFRNGPREIKSMPSGTESCTHTVAYRTDAARETRYARPLLSSPVLFFFSSLFNPPSISYIPSLLPPTRNRFP